MNKGYLQVWVPLLFCIGDQATRQCSCLWAANHLRRACCLVLCVAHWQFSKSNTCCQRRIILLLYPIGWLPSVTLGHKHNQTVRMRFFTGSRGSTVTLYISLYVSFAYAAHDGCSFLSFTSFRIHHSCSVTSPSLGSRLFLFCCK